MNAKQKAGSSRTGGRNLKHEFRMMARDMSRSARVMATSAEFKKLERDFVDAVTTTAKDFKNALVALGKKPEAQGVKRHAVNIARAGKDATVTKARAMKATLSKKINESKQRIAVANKRRKAKK